MCRDAKERYTTDMKYLYIFLAIVLAVTAYSAISFWRKVRVSSSLVQKAVPYSLKGNDALGQGVRLLVLGDSTAVGVGADKPEDTLAARMARHIGATHVENYAISGARVRDLAKEVRQIQKEKYNYILIGIGANDIIRFGDAEETARHLAVILSGLPKRDHLILYMAGDVGGTQLFPRILNSHYTRRTMEFHDAFAKTVSEAGGTYVNLYIDPKEDPFTLHPEINLAADGLHPTSAGYGVWFDRIRPVLQ